MAIDPVILQLKAEVDDYNRKVDGAQKNTDRKLDLIEKRGFAMGQKLKAGFSMAQTAAVAFVGAIAVDKVVQAISAGLEYASSLGEIAQQLGVTTSELQEYRYAASQAGLSNEEMDQALSQLTRRIGEAARGTKAQSEAFDKLGISVRDANGKIITAGSAIPLIADALARIESPAERAAVLMDLFGRSGQKLEALLGDGAAGVNNLRDAAHKLGIVLSDKQIQSADDAADKLGAVKQVLEARIAGVVADNADSIIELADALANLAEKAIRAAAAWANFWSTTSNRDAMIARANKIISERTDLSASDKRAAYGLVPGAVDRQMGNRSQSAGGILGALGLKQMTYGANGSLAGKAMVGSFLPLPTEVLEALAEADRKALRLKIDGIERERAALQAEADAETDREKRREIEASILRLVQQEERDRLSIQISDGEVADARRAVADLERKHAAERTVAGRPRETPFGRFMDELNDPDRTRDEIEYAVIGELQGVRDGITSAVQKTLGVKNPLLAAIINSFIEQQLIRPFVERLSGAGGGGFLGSVIGAVGSIFGGGPTNLLSGTPFGRASGGYVSPGQMYRINEGATPGRVEAFIPNGGGHIVPLGRMNALAGGQQAAGVATVRLELSGDIDARIQQVSGPVAVEVVRASAPTIIKAASAETLARSRRPSL